MQLSKEDGTHLIRCVMKISSAFEDADQVIDEKVYYKYMFKKRLDEWMHAMYIHTGELLKSLTKDSDKITVDVYNGLSDVTAKVQAGGYKTALLILYVKIKSAMNDLEKIDPVNANKFYVSVIKFYTNRVIKQIEKQHKFVTMIVDADGKDVNFLIDFFDNFGSMIMKNDEL